MPPDRDPVTGRFVKSGGGQSLGEARARITIDASGMTGSARTADAAARQIEATGSRINRSLGSVAQGFRQAEAAAKAFAKTDMGQIQRGLKAAQESVQAYSLASAGLVAVGLRQAQNENLRNARFKVFLGSEQAAARELANIRKQADATGQSFVGLADTASQLLGLTKTYNVEVGKLVVLSQQLQAVDPTARAFDVSVATREFLSGNPLSLVRRFEGLDPNEIEKITKSSGSAAEKVQMLSKYLADLGFGQDLLRELADEGTFAFENLGSEIQQALATAFMPLLKDFVLPAVQGFGAFLRNLRETNPELLKLASAGAVIVAGIAPALIIMNQLINAYKTLKIVSAVSTIKGALSGGVGRAAGAGLAVAGGIGLGLEGARFLANNTNLQTGDLNRIREGEDPGAILGERLKQLVGIVVVGIGKAAEGLSGVLAGGAAIIQQGFELINAALDYAQGQILIGFGNVLTGIASLFDTLNPATAQGLRALGEVAREGMLIARDGQVFRTAGGRQLTEMAGARLAQGIDGDRVQGEVDTAMNGVRILTQGLVSLLFPVEQVEQTADAAAEALAEVPKATNPLVDSLMAAQDDIVEAARNIARLQRDFREETARINEERQISADRDTFDFGLSRSRSDADRARQQAREEQDILRGRNKAIRDLNEQLSQSEIETATRINDLQIKAAEEQEKRAIKHGERLAEIQERTNSEVANAAARLDANAVFEALDSGRQEASSEVSSFNQETAERRAALDEQISDLRRSIEVERQTRLAALQQQFADEEAERAIRRQREAEDLAIQRQREDEDRAIRLQRQAEDYNRQDNLRRAALQRQINDQIAALSEATGINQRLLSVVVNTLAAAGGQVANFVNYVNQAVAQLGVSAGGTLRGATNTSVGRIDPRFTPTFASGGMPPLNTVVRANERGMESALINGQYFARFSQPAQIFNAQQTAAMLGSGAGGSVSLNIDNFAPVFGDIGNRSDEDVVGMIRMAIMQAAEDIASMTGGMG